MELIPPVIAGVLTGLIAVWAALYQARSKQLWDRKDAKYRELLDALSAMLKEYEARERAYYAQRDFPGPDELEIQDAGRRASDVVWTQAVTGGFIISDEAVKVLRKMESELDEAWETGLNNIDGPPIIREAINEIIKVGKADLASLLAVWWKPFGSKRT